MIISAVNDREPYRTQRMVLATSLNLNSPSDESVLETLDADKTREYMVCYRTEMFVRYLEKHDAVAWFDTDCIVRKPLAGFWHDVVEDSIKIVFRPEKKEKRRFQAGVFAFGSGTHVRRMVSEWNEDVQKNPAWYKDQESLYLHYMKYRDRIKLIPMPEKFNDSSFRTSSTIWHSKEHHFLDRTFQKEYQHYLKAAMNGL